MQPRNSPTLANAWNSSSLTTLILREKFKMAVIVFTPVVVVGVVVVVAVVVVVVVVVVDVVPSPSPSSELANIYGYCSVFLTSSLEFVKDDEFSSPRKCHRTEFFPLLY